MPEPANRCRAHEPRARGPAGQAPGPRAQQQTHGETKTSLEQLDSDDQLLLVLGCSPAVDDVVHRLLGQLARQDSDTRRIRHTVDAYLSTGGDVARVSKVLYVHRNTVRYRLRRAEMLLGTGISRFNPGLLLAIRHVDRFHDDELDPVGKTKVGVSR